MDSLVLANKIQKRNLFIYLTLTYSSACRASGDISAIYFISIDFLIFFIAIYYACKVKVIKNKILAMISIVLLFFTKNILYFEITFVGNKPILAAATGVFIASVIIIIIYSRK